MQIPVIRAALFWLLLLLPAYAQQGGGGGGGGNTTVNGCATAGTSILKGNNAGGCTNATASTDYAPATSGTSLLKGNGSGGFGNAIAGTDYLAPGGALGTPSSGTLTNATGLPLATGITGFGAGVLTPLETSVNTSGGFPTVPIANSSLANDTISGVALGQNLAVLSYGTHLTNGSGASTYNGSAASRIAVDATNADTPSTMVARDSAGNFSAGTISADIIGENVNQIAYNAIAYSGIVCNGVNDDTAGIAALMTTAATTGGIVQLPGQGANCLTSSTIDIPEGVILAGAGMAGGDPSYSPTKFGTTITWTGSSTGGPVVQFVDGKFDTGIRDLRINVGIGSPGANSPVGLQVNGDIGAEARNIAVENAGVCFAFGSASTSGAVSVGVFGKWSQLHCQNAYNGFVFDGGTNNTNSPVTDFDIFGIAVNNYVNYGLAFYTNGDNIKIHGIYIQGQGNSGSIGIIYNPANVSYDANVLTPVGATELDGITFANATGDNFLTCNKGGGGTGSGFGNNNVLNFVNISGSGTLTPTLDPSCPININQLQSVTYSSGAIGTTSTDAVDLANQYSATSGTQQWSPRLHWQGQGWKSNATAASQTVDVISELQTASGGSAAGGNLVFSGQVNGGGYIPIFQMPVAGCVSYSPTDQSGASLSFTGVTFHKCQYGPFVYLYGTLTYPSTANTNNAIISLPVSVPNAGYAEIPATCFSTAVSGLQIVAIPNTQTAAFKVNVTGAVTNANLSLATIYFMLIYPAS